MVSVLCLLFSFFVPYRNCQSQRLAQEQSRFICSIMIKIKVISRLISYHWSGLSEFTLIWVIQTVWRSGWSGVQRWVIANEWDNIFWSWWRATNGHINGWAASTGDLFWKINSKKMDDIVAGCHRGHRMWVLVVIDARNKENIKSHTKPWFNELMLQLCCHYYFCERLHNKVKEDNTCSVENNTFLLWKYLSNDVNSASMFLLW